MPPFSVLICAISMRQIAAVTEALPEMGRNLISAVSGTAHENPGKILYGLIRDLDQSTPTVIAYFFMCVFLLRNI